MRTRVHPGHTSRLLAPPSSQLGRRKLHSTNPSSVSAVRYTARYETRSVTRAIAQQERAAAEASTTAPALPSLEHPSLMLQQARPPKNREEGEVLTYTTVGGIVAMLRQHQSRFQGVFCDPEGHTVKIEAGDGQIVWIPLADAGFYADTCQLFAHGTSAWPCALLKGRLRSTLNEAWPGRWEIGTYLVPEPLYNLPANPIAYPSATTDESQRPFALHELWAWNGKNCQIQDVGQDPRKRKETSPDKDEERMEQEEESDEEMMVDEDEEARPLETHVLSTSGSSLSENSKAVARETFGLDYLSAPTPRYANLISDLRHVLSINDPMPSTMSSASSDDLPLLIRAHHNLGDPDLDPDNAYSPSPPTPSVVSYASRAGSPDIATHAKDRALPTWTTLTIDAPSSSRADNLNARVATVLSPTPRTGLPNLGREIPRPAAPFQTAFPPLGLAAAYTTLSREDAQAVDDTVDELANDDASTVPATSETEESVEVEEFGRELRPEELREALHEDVQRDFPGTSQPYHYLTQSHLERVKVDTTGRPPSPTPPRAVQHPQEMATRYHTVAVTVTLPVVQATDLEDTLARLHMQTEPERPNELVDVMTVLQAPSATQDLLKAYTVVLQQLALHAGVTPPRLTLGQIPECLEDMAARISEGRVRECRPLQNLLFAEWRTTVVSALRSLHDIALQHGLLDYTLDALRQVLLLADLPRAPHSVDQRHRASIFWLQSFVLNIQQDDIGLMHREEWLLLAKMQALFEHSPPSNEEVGSRKLALDVIEAVRTHAHHVQVTPELANSLRLGTYGGPLEYPPQKSLTGWVDALLQRDAA